MFIRPCYLTGYLYLVIKKRNLRFDGSVYRLSKVGLTIGDSSHQRPYWLALKKQPFSQNYFLTTKDTNLHFNKRKGNYL